MIQNLYGILIKNDNPNLNNKQFALQELRRAGFSFPITVNLDLKSQFNQGIGQLPFTIGADIRISKTYFSEADFPEKDDQHSKNVWWVKYEAPAQIAGTDKLLEDLVAVIQKHQPALRPLEMLGAIEVIKVWVQNNLMNKGCKI